MGTLGNAFKIILKVRNPLDNPHEKEKDHLKKLLDKEWDSLNKNTFQGLQRNLADGMCGCLQFWVPLNQALKEHRNWNP